MSFRCKVTSLMLACAIAFCACACGKNKSEKKKSKNTERGNVGIATEERGKKYDYDDTLEFIDAVLVDYVEGKGIEKENDDFYYFEDYSGENVNIRFSSEDGFLFSGDRKGLNPWQVSFWATDSNGKKHDVYFCLSTGVYSEQLKHPESDKSYTITDGSVISGTIVMIRIEKADTEKCFIWIKPDSVT